MASATAAWIAYRRRDQETVRRAALHALEVWAALPNRYPLDWMSCFPLLGVAVHRRDPSQARRWAEMMLMGPQQHLPQPLATPLGNALDALSAGRIDDAMTQFTDGLACAVDLGYL